MGDMLYFVEAKSPLVSLTAQEFERYITTSEEFKQFSLGVLDIEGKDVNDPIFSRYIRRVLRVKPCGEQNTSVTSPEGQQQVFNSRRGRIKVGYTELNTALIYVELNGVYLRGFKVDIKDLCLVDAMNFVPLDKSEGTGNILILQHTKRKATKAIKVVHNEVQSVLYLVDAEFKTKSEMEQDKASPKDIDLSLFLLPLL